ncbi:hypothetical protein DVH24_042197 [Malus domestica]|uniref:Uncharacterized protein n=1 Tax=Malus domestica TaxID=3750 RepID=A0A498IYE6_MALDO|nr:hypothetical protein DVH24_042197 [Malus domestica]
MFNVIYYFIFLTIFKVIPDPFQSLNTKASIFKRIISTVHCFRFNLCRSYVFRSETISQPFHKLHFRSSRPESLLSSLISPSSSRRALISSLSLCDEFRPATGPPPHLTNCRVHYFTSSSSFPSTTHGPPQASSSFFFFLHLR